MTQIEMEGDFVRCAEDSEERGIAELISEYHEYREAFSSKYTDVYGEFSEGEDLARVMR